MKTIRLILFELADLALIVSMFDCLLRYIDRYVAGHAVSQVRSLVRNIRRICQNTIENAFTRPLNEVTF